MRVLTMENRWGRSIPLPRKMILDVVNRRDGLPGVTNLPLVAAWRRVVARQTPALVITAADKLRGVFFDRVNRVMLSGVSMTSVRQVPLGATNHIFTSGNAIERIRDHVLSWTFDHFGSTENVVALPPSARAVSAG
jgi:hypothetical protein